MILIYIVVIYQLIILAYYSLRFIYRHFIMKEKNLLKRYGENSYVMITGASSGQGYHFAHEFAKRGFNLFLIGSKRTSKTIREIQEKYPSIKIVFVEKDFRKASEPDFFNDIKSEIEGVGGNVSILVNNVGYRTAWMPYHDMDEQLINDTIIVGTIVQSRLTRLLIPYFIKRKEHNAIINITAQCIMPTYGFGEILNNEVSVPFLSVYEAANAFGYYQTNSLIKEYEKYKMKIDILNVMPGAVLTENTEYLKSTIFSVNVDTFVKNIMKNVGNVTGNCYGYWGHELSIMFVNIVPFLKTPTLYKTGKTIALNYMSTPKKKY